MSVQNLFYFNIQSCLFADLSHCCCVGISFAIYDSCISYYDSHMFFISVQKYIWPLQNKQTKNPC